MAFTPTAFMQLRFILTLLLFSLAAYAVAFGTGAALVKLLSKPWRRATGAHWTEQARLGFAPGFAVLWLAVLFPPITALLGGAVLESLKVQHQWGMLEFWVPWLAAFAGALTARYRWLREAWGPRVTIRSWSAGCLIVLFLFLPHFVITLALLFLLPDIPSGRSVILMAAGVLAVAFFAGGGAVRLLRLLRVIRLAPAEVTEMVTQLAEAMKVAGLVRVFELEWAQVNAVAWPRYRAVGFSRPLLEIMTPEELRAIAAHELAHLLEPRWVRAVRVAHMFAYLVVPPVVKYGGSGGALIGWLLLMAIVLGYRRFTRRMEVRADRLESDAIADAKAYMRSMIKLHEANLQPAVMPGAQTHPHLYDRLLAGGIQPDFPRPMAPSRAKPFLAVLAAGLGAAVVMFMMMVVLMLAQGPKNVRPKDSTADLPAGYQTGEEERVPDPSEPAKVGATPAQP